MESVTILLVLLNCAKKKKPVDIMGLVGIHNIQFK